MELKELKKIIPLTDNDILVNGMDVIEHHFFNTCRPSEDYRKEGIKFMLKKRLGFNTTCNNNFTFASQFLQVKCPKCKTILKSGGGGGSTNRQTINFHCKKCNLNVSVTTPDDGYSVTFND